MLYLVSLIVTQGCTDFLQTTKDSIDQLKYPEHYENIQRAFGSLFVTQYTLFKSMIGGVSWGEVADPLLSVSMIYFGIFIAYITFVLFSVLNIVTGVFVDSAIQVGNRDRGILVDKQKKNQDAITVHLLTLLEEIDEDRSGEISTEELFEALKKDHIMSYFNALQIETRDINQLVALLDDDCSGSIGIVEFVDGLQELKGHAKSLDIHVILRQNQLQMRLLQHLEDTVVSVAERIGIAVKHLDPLPEHSAAIFGPAFIRVSCQDGTGGFSASMQSEGRPA